MPSRDLWSHLTSKLALPDAFSQREVLQVEQPAGCTAQGWVRRHQNHFLPPSWPSPLPTFGQLLLG